MKFLSVIFAVVSFILLVKIAHAGLSGSGFGQYILVAQCGNNICETDNGEGCSCSDCTSVLNCDGICGNSVCDANETNANCLVDCPPLQCGNNICDAASGETCSSCP